MVASVRSLHKVYRKTHLNSVGEFTEGKSRFMCDLGAELGHSIPLPLCQGKLPLEGVQTKRNTHNRPSAYRDINSLCSPTFLVLIIFPN